MGRAPLGQCRNVTLISTVTPQGTGPSLVIEGAADRLDFDAFVEQLLVPFLRPGQTVVLDNLSVRKSAVARDWIEAAGCHLRFLPTYAPGFNSIEQAFAKIKTRLQLAEARTLGELVTATRDGLNAIKATDAQAFYRDAGHHLTEQLL